MQKKSFSTTRFDDEIRRRDSKTRFNDEIRRCAWLFSSFLPGNCFGHEILLSNMVSLVIWVLLRRWRRLLFLCTDDGLRFVFVCPKRTAACVSKMPLFSCYSHTVIPMMILVLLITSSCLLLFNRYHYNHQHAIQGDHDCGHECRVMAIRGNPSDCLERDTKEEEQINCVTFFYFFSKT